jgi:hypothetical protein
MNAVDPLANTPVNRWYLQSVWLVTWLVMVVLLFVFLFFFFTR